MRRAIISALLAGMLATTGCVAVGPDYEPPKQEAPQAWQMPEDPALKRGTAELEEWWQVFHDPQLTALVGQACRENLDLKAAVARVLEARYQVGVAAGYELPSLDASGDAERQRTSAKANQGFGVEQNLFSAGLQASWEIDLFGRIRRSVESAQASYQASQADRDDVLVSLTAEVAGNYIQVRALQARLAAARENIQSQREVLKITQSRFDNGLATGLDVSQANQVLASSEAEVPPLVSSLIQTYNALALLLAQPPGRIRGDLEKIKPIPTPPLSVAVDLPADLMRRRPDIRNKERLLAAATANIGVATADLYPSFTLSGSLGLAASSLGDLGASGSGLYGIGAGFNWNIFAGGRIRSQIKVADAKTQQALYAYEQTVLGALGEVDSALHAYVQQRLRTQALLRTVEASRQSLKLALRLYTDGLADFQRVLDAQRSLFDFDNQLAQAKGETASNLVQLYRALGGGWKPAPLVLAPAPALGWDEEKK